MHNVLIPLTYDKHWLDTVGQTMNCGQHFMRNRRLPGGALVASPAVRTRCMIPMYMLSPLFGYGRLLPAMLMSGLRIEILWAQKDQAFQDTGFTNLNIAENADAKFESVTIHDPQFVLASV